MALEEINNEETGLEIRAKLNRMFAELYSKKPKTYRPLVSENEEVEMNTLLGLSATITLTEDVTLTLSNLSNGDEGNIIVTQGTEVFELFIEPTPLVINCGNETTGISKEAGSITVISYSYDGERLFVNYKHNQIADEIHFVKYGYLYNWYAATDERNIANDGWHVSSNTDLQLLLTTVGDDSALKLSEFGTEYSIPFDNPATNSAKFNIRQSGFRAGGEFLGFGDITATGIYFLGVLTDLGMWENMGYRVIYNDTNILDSFRSSGSHHTEGQSIRLIKDSTTLADGESGTYTGNDGKIYRTICIGTQEWLADNLAETRYRNQDEIPTVTDNEAWTLLLTGAKCAYNNDESNV